MGYELEQCSQISGDLPTVSFVGGSEQVLEFYTYRDKTGEPFDLVGCTARLSAVSAANRSGKPVILVDMSITSSDDSDISNVLVATLQGSDTVNLEGKYIYQISIMDSDGTSDIPRHGIFLISRNIDKAFISE
jgi:hypothetical protein